MTKTFGSVKIKYIVAMLAGVALVYFLVSALVDNRFKELELQTKVQIADQSKLLVTIAETTARNGADVVTESIVKDCAMEERIKFDDLLGRLDKGLAKEQLIELDRLFGRCGNFSADRKSMMVARMSREIEIYEMYVNQLSTITGEDQSELFKVVKWQMLAAEEEKQSDLFRKLVLLQDKIITALLAGNTATSPEIVGILQEVKEVQETLIVANKQAGTHRSELTAI